MLLGILGGMGPMSSVYFYELLTSLTKADCDSDHIDLVLSSRATTPDRSSFIMGKSDKDPLDAMLADSKKLVAFGADVIAIPCNTAHYFYNGLAKAVDVPILNIIEETVKTLQKDGIKRFGLLATEGTVASGTYAKYCEKHGIECVIPEKEQQDRITKIIFGEIKSGKEPDMDSFYMVAENMKKLGCEKLVLGCTELSLIKKSKKLNGFFVDSLECLALATIKASNKKSIYDI